MMSSPHVGFVTWNSDGWSYPKTKWITLSEDSKMLVSVDWTKVRSDKTGTVVIKGNDQTVKLKVQTSYTDYKSKGIGTHIESHDVVTIDGKEYANNTGSTDGVSWECIHGYGRYDSVMKMFPVTESFTKKTGNTYQVKVGNNTRTVTEYEPPTEAPYLEYRFYVDEDDDYTFTAYTTPTNNIFKPSDWGYVPVELFYGIQVDDNQIQNVNSLPDGKYISYAADGDNRWKDGIMNNIHVFASKRLLYQDLHQSQLRLPAAIRNLYHNREQLSLCRHNRQQHKVLADQAQRNLPKEKPFFIKK